MKIELKKEKKPFKPVLYYTEVDGEFVSGSIETTEDKAREKYLEIIKNGSMTHCETIETTEI